MAQKTLTLEQLIEKLDEVGWKEGITNLEHLHKMLEERQAWLFSGDQDQVHQASQMSSMLLKQDEALIRLHQIAKERGINLG